MIQIKVEELKQTADIFDDCCHQLQNSETELNNLEKQFNQAFGQNELTSAVCQCRLNLSQRIDEINELRQALNSIETETVRTESRVAQRASGSLSVRTRGSALPNVRISPHELKKYGSLF